MSEMTTRDQRSIYRLRALPPFHSYPLLRKETLVEGVESENVLPVRRFTFAYVPETEFGLRPAMQHLKVMPPGLKKARSYTPTSDATSEGSFHLTIKIYPGGKCSEWLDQVGIGTRVMMIGPLPLPIKKKISDEPGEDALIVVIALGVGITHGIAVVREELTKKRMRVLLVYSVRQKKEVLFEEEIQELKEQHKEFDTKFLATAEEVPRWHYGRITPDLLKEYVGMQPKEQVRFDVTGTKGMIKQVWGMLSEIGFQYNTHALIKKSLKK